MTKENSYKETKQCACICCGDMVTVTKFASAAKVVCDNCKNSGAQPNPSIIVQPKKDEVHIKHEGATKILPCTICGKEVEVTKFASAAKVICDDCKDESGGYSERNEINMNVKIDMKKLDRNVVPILEEYVATPSLINNTRLRMIVCPACGHEHMKILKVLDWSVSGLIIHYQCPKCMALVSISEQAKNIIKTYSEGTIYDYSGKAIETVGLSSIASSRMNTTIQKLMSILKDNNIEIEGEKLPPYMWDNKRPVPVGYRVPHDDRTIKIIDDVIQLLDSAVHQGSSTDIQDGIEYIKIDKTLTKHMSEELKKLFEEDKLNDQD